MYHVILSLYINFIFVLSYHANVIIIIHIYVLMILFVFIDGLLCCYVIVFVDIVRVRVRLNDCGFVLLHLSNDLLHC